MKRGASPMLVSGEAHAASKAGPQPVDFDSAEDVAEAVRRIKLQSYFKSAQTAAPVSIIAAIAVAAVLAPRMPIWIIASWLGVMVALSGTRLFVARALKKAPHRTWLDRCFLGLTVGTGIAWGGVLSLIPPGTDAMVITLVTFTMAGITAGAAVSSAARPFASVLYNIPALAGISLFYIQQGGTVSYVMAGLAVIYMIFMHRFAKMGEATLDEALSTNQALQASRKRVESQARALKELARRHESAARRAEEATQAKSSFLANISHEIRTPLNGLMSLAHNLEKDTELSGQQRTKVRTLRLAGDMMMRLVGDLLDFSKIEAGRMTLVPCRMTMAQLAHDIEALWADRAAERKLEFSVTCDGPSNLGVSGDNARLKQIIFNLVANALKFTENGRVEVLLTLSEAGAGTSFRAEVRDTGPGVPREAQGRLFKDYSQLDDTSGQRLEGAGLGLAISRRLIELMQGKIGHMPGEPSGSVFWFEVALPRAGQVAPAAVSEPRRIEASPSDAPKPIERPLRILAAEDNAINRSVLEGFLMSQGWSVDFAENGREAVEAAHARAYDVILMDMRMPVMDGLAATRAIRDLPTTASMTPIVALTANARPEDEAACLAAGMDGYVSKPIDARRLFGAISQAISSASEASVAPQQARRA